ncbi:MAG: tRNA lysidine(34) synthetase TilS [Clostridia bacterium]|nr:tRNA lysidine(34) synthetase TilS [Clostridia bacterium]
MNAIFDRLLSGKTVGVAVSGGMDSMALLHYAKKAEQKLNICVIAINIEHGIRGQESVSDSAFVKDYCKSHDIPLISFSVDAIALSKTDGISVEESARKLRYDCFDKVLKNNQCDFILTAHHKSDLAESVLINLLRGTSIKGLKGIPYKRDKFIRPLINTPKDAIRAYVERENVPYINDSTNFDDLYTRNFLRLKVIPLLKERFPQFEDGVLRLSSLAEKEDEFLDDLAEKFVVETDGAIKIDLSANEVLLNRAFIIALKKIGIKKDYEKKHTDMLNSLSTDKNGVKICMPQGVTAVKEYDFITLYKKTEKLDLSIPFSLGETNFNGKTISVKHFSKESDGLYFDLDKLPKTAVFRTRRDGDLFKPFNSGTKKLKEYLIDKKIPSRLRDELILIADGNTVYCIIGIEISDLVKTDENTINKVQIN